MHIEMRRRKNILSFIYLREPWAAAFVRVTKFSFRPRAFGCDEKECQTRAERTPCSSQPRLFIPAPGVLAKKAVCGHEFLAIRTMRIVKCDELLYFESD